MIQSLFFAYLPNHERKLPSKIQFEAEHGNSRNALPPSRRRGDGQELMTRVCLWNKAGDDIGDMVSRSRRVVDTMQELLGGQGRSNSGCMRMCNCNFSFSSPLQVLRRVSCRCPELVPPSPGNLSLPLEADDEVRRGKVFHLVHLNSLRICLFFRLAEGTFGIKTMDTGTRTAV